MKVDQYFANLNAEKYPALFAPDFIEGSKYLRDRYKDQDTHQLGYETVLNVSDNSCDIAFRVDNGGELSGNTWLEFDREVYEGAAVGKELTPCVFLDASCLRPKRKAEELTPFFDADLAGLVGTDKAKRFKEPLLALAEKLSGKCRSLFQVGSMDSRMPSDSLRVYTKSMTAKDAAALLDELSWPGDKALASAVLSDMEPYAYGGRFTLSFDLYPDNSISEKAGIEFHVPQTGPESLDAFLACLTERGHCVPAKAQALKDWIREKPVYASKLQNDIAHFKFTIAAGRIKTVKAYIRQSDEFGIFDYHRAYRNPVIMNIELTTKCPLRCPQCYVHLNDGKEIDPEVAIRRIREAKTVGIDTICLSGGETLCYSHLSELIRECRSLGLRSAVAISGIYADRDTLAGMIEDGVDEIFVSLNGSTEEINSLTRDGYGPAVKALESLRELHFENTRINWVMHDNNAHDLQGMIELCESFGVSELVILAFKPDSSSEWKSFPSAAQMEEAARLIKTYKGPVTITAEACFSQLRALLGRSALLGNRNTGISRGCGAGRDGVSVNVDGKLTPCRHLDVIGEYDSIAEYWEKSPFLQKLRSVEDSRKEPCRGCVYEKNCLPCMATGCMLHGELTYGLKECRLAAE